MTLTDLLLVAAVALFAVAGYYRGFVGQVLSLAGVALGVVVGAWLAPHVLPGDSGWVPLASVIGAALGAFLAGLATGSLAAVVRGTLSATPVLGLVDRMGGAVVGGILGLALGWVAAVLFLNQPSLGLRRAVQTSAILPALVRAVPPEPVLRTLERFDPLPILEFGPGRLPEPDESVLRSAVASRAQGSVLRIEGTSCGLGVRGSGWVMRSGLVATNAHVVSGQTDTEVFVPGEEGRRDATIVYLDPRDDVALLRVRGLRAKPLPVSTGGDFPRQVVLLGYPGGGDLEAAAATAGSARTVLAPNAYGESVSARTIVPLRGRVRKGESGGPVVDGSGEVVAMIFGASKDRRGGFGVPALTVIEAATGGLGPVDPGPCVG
jgi:S1-C subfamily serine protease